MLEYSLQRWANYFTERTHIRAIILGRSDQQGDCDPINTTYRHSDLRSSADPYVDRLIIFCD